MNLFKDQELLYKLFGFALVLIFVYFQLILRREKIISSLFKEDSIYRLVPEKVFFLKNLKDKLLLASIFLIAFSAAGPQWGREFAQSEGFSGNIAVALDTSLSMSASDIKPSRLESAKIAVKYLFKELSDYKFAVIAFQGKPYIQCPMTSDYDALSFFADSVKPDMLPAKGTNIPALIKTAAQYMSRYEGEKLLVIFTDGEDHHKDEIKEALSAAQKSSLKIMTVSIGTTEGDLIKDPKTGEYKKDEMGNTVLSRLDEKHLVTIAEATKGKYLKYSTPENVSEEIRSFAETLKKASSQSKNFSIYKNRYQIPLFIAFLLILIEFILMEEKVSFSFSSFLKNKSVNFIFLLLFLPSVSFSLTINDEAAKGNESYKKENYSEAYGHYKKAYGKNQNDKILFNMGNALHKMEEYSKAAEVFESIKDEKLKAKALYNAGNARYMSQDKDKALENYKKALILSPKDERAAYNLQVLLENKKNSCSSDQQQNKDQNKENEKDKDKKEENKPQENKNKDNPERKRAEQILNMMKEKEKENRKKADRQKASPQSSDEYEKNDW
ncbi:MAG: VWA domain-containing protein [Elusimicrobiota bacterium]